MYWVDENIFEGFTNNELCNTWDTTNITTMVIPLLLNINHYEYDFSEFNVDISDWNTTKHEKYDYEQWDVSKVTDMSGMFKNATNFNQIYLIGMFLMLLMLLIFLKELHQ